MSRCLNCRFFSLIFHPPPFSLLFPLYSATYGRHNRALPAEAFSFVPEELFKSGSIRAGQPGGMANIAAMGAGLAARFGPSSKG